MRRGMGIALVIVVIGLAGAGVVLVDPAGWFESAVVVEPTLEPPATGSPSIVDTTTQESSECAIAMQGWLDKAVEGGNNRVVVDEVIQGVQSSLGQVPESFWPTVGGLQTNAVSTAEAAAEIALWCEDSSQAAPTDVTNGLVATDPQQAVDILQTAWFDDNRNTALAVADPSVVDELFAVPIDERSEYDFHHPSCEEKPDGSAVCSFQYYACCPAELIFEWRGAEGYKAAAISNPAD